MSVIFDQLRISDDGKKMFINLHVNNADYFDDVYLKRITILTEDQVSEINPFYPGNDFIYQKEIFSNGKCETPCGEQHCQPKHQLTRDLDLVLTSYDFNEKFTVSDLSHNLFFIYIECAGIPAPNVPCRLDEMTTLGVTFDYGIIFNSAMNFTKELADTCNIPQNYINFILNYEALKMSIETEHYIPAINFWKNIVGQKGIFNSNNINSKPCGCHG